MRLYWKFAAIHLKSSMAYPAAFAVMVMGRLLLTVNGMLGIFFLLDRFGSIGGYELPEILLGYGVVLTASGLAECFGRGFDAFGKIVRQGMLDRLLVRPRGMVFQIICQDMRIAMFSSILMGVGMIAYGAAAMEIQWTFGKLLVLLLMVLSGGLIFFGMFLLYATLCFFTLEGLEVMNILTDGIREFSRYPFAVYGKGVLWFLTCVVPMALVQYWPMQYLMNRGPAWYGCLPVVALLFLLPCGLLWKFGLRHYCSSGS